ncbi:MAG TPA: hypothetical protein VFT48_08995 [Pyrinomonadaceae bacterium]|nr:hypothetical protein [Pyrinomonadaceae bacterium]
MKQSVLLTITSLLTLLFLSLHHADDVVRGFAPGKFSNLIVIVFMVLWLYSTTLVLAERRSGYILILVLCLLGAGIPVIHMTGAGMSGGRIANSRGAFFFVWTLVIIGAMGLFSVLLAARELWRLRRKD